MKSTNAAPFLIRAMFRRAALRVPAGSSQSKKVMRRKRPLPVEKWMKSLTLLALIAFGIAVSAVALYLPLHAQSGNQANITPLQTATGQYITPTAVPGAVQQFLNPGLPMYPNFVAGEAVRSQLSPDGKTLAILCAGQNSLVKTDGNN